MRLLGMRVWHCAVNSAVNHNILRALCFCLKTLEINVVIIDLQ